MKNKLFKTVPALLLVCLTGLMSSCGTANMVLLDNPQEMNRTMKGDPEKSRIVWKSDVLPAKPNTWYRASVEIKSAFKGDGNWSVASFRVRQIAENDESIVYADIARLKPTFLDYDLHSDVFLTRPNAVALQVYYQLSFVDGTVSFRNLKLEEIKEEEAERIRASYKVPPAYFSPPVFAYEGQKELSWGYRVSADFLTPPQIPAKISFQVPQLNAADSADVTVNTHAVTQMKLAAPLKAGKYTVIMTALDASGREIAGEERVLRVIPRLVFPKRLPVRSVRIDEEGNTVINGRPALIRGLYHVYTEPQVKEAADAGFNTIIAWESTPGKYGKMLSWLAKYDLYADCVIKRLPEDKLAELLGVIGRHPAIISFDPEDEPDIKDMPPERIMPRVDQIRKTCPGKPLRISCANPNEVKRYGTCAEILCTHNYVIPFGGLPHQVRSTDIVVASFPYPRRHSPQMTLQSWVHWHDLTRKPQTPEQTRSLAYAALIGGAKGIWWHAFISDGWDVRHVPSVWTALIGLNAELENLNDVILTGKRLDIKIETLSADGKPQEGGVIGAVWQLPGRTVLAAVNTMKEPRRARISGLPGERFRELFADDAVCTVSGGMAELEIAPETSRVFELEK